MIAVIADDLTGAAELGGIGLRYGLKVEVRTAVPSSSGAGLLVIAGDSRSKEQAGAIEEMTVITRQLRLLKPEWIYKKADSVLRGHVLAELKAHLQVLDYRLALLIPANPSLGRTIRDGQYYLNGKPINESSFSDDPEFPIHSSDIQVMLHSAEHSVLIRKPDSELPVRGIVVGEVQTPDDLRAWAAHIPSKTLLAGAAEFFSTLLAGRMPVVPAAHFPALSAPILYVRGSTFEANRDSIRKLAAIGGPVTYMADTPWEQQVADDLRTHGKAIIAIEAGEHGQSAQQLRTAMAESVAGVMRLCQPAELIIEGGSTAYAIFQRMGWQTFLPEQELAPGVVRMSVPDVPGLHITVKPGSYGWPPAIRY